MDDDSEVTFAVPRTRDRWFLEDMTGLRHPVFDAVVVGRSPGELAGQRGWTPLEIADDDSLSKAHVLVEPDGDAVLVTDLGSTNGTVAADLGGPRRALPQGERVRVEAGTVLELGGVLLTVVRF